MVFYLSEFSVFSEIWKIDGENLGYLDAAQGT